MLLPALIETARLQLRRPRTTDGWRIAEGVQETLPDLVKWFRWGEPLARVGDLEDLGARATTGQRRFDELSNPVYLLWHDTQFVGELLINNPHEATEGVVELQVWVRRSAQNRGYGSEALQAMIRHLFEVQGCPTLEALVDARNGPSRKLFQQAGFVPYGHRDDHSRYILTAPEGSARHLGVVVLSHPECLEHQVGRDHPERPERLEAVLEGLEGLDVTLLGAPRDRASTVLAHAEGYVEQLADRVPEDGITSLDADTDVSERSVDAALRGVGGVVAGVDLVRAGRASSVFVATRPPGHHALPEKTMGFCLFATAAIGALHARKVRRYERVAVFDFDVHHGNGTQAILEREPDILFISTHESELFPHSGSASATESASGNVLNVPMGRHTSGAAYRKRVSEVALPRLRDFRPEIIIASAGFDGHARDHRSSMTLSAEDYRWVTERLRELAPVVSMLEGGYDLVGLALSARAHVEALLEAAAPVP